MKLRALMLGVVLGMVSGFACGASHPPCNATTCRTGCCDAAGLCQTGNLATACGNGGFACQVCLSNALCTFGSCLSNGNGGSGGNTGGAGGFGGQGGTGGSAGAAGTGGGTGGGTPTCTAAASLALGTTAGTYLPGSFLFTVKNNGATSNIALLELVANIQAGATVPGSASLSQNSLSLNSSPWVAVYGDGCTFSLGRYSCGRTFGGVAGTVSINSLSGTLDAGTLSAAAANLSLVQVSVDAGVLVPISGGACLTLSSASWSATWP